MYYFNEQEFNNLGVILKLFSSLKFSNLSNAIYLDGNKIYTCEVIMGVSRHIEVIIFQLLNIHA